MTNLINVVVSEDKSVERVLNRTAKNLRQTYEKKRKINERRLAQSKSPVTRVLMVIFDVLCACLVVFCGLLCFANLNSRSQGVAPSFAGFASMRIVSGSMRASGFEVGDNIVVRSVDTKTLKVGDNIAFYAYFGDYSQFDINGCTAYSYDGDTKYSISLARFMGAQSNQIAEAAKNGSKLVFHQITAVFKDQSSGVLWFQTKGTSNAEVDSWFISENMIMGIYDNSAAAKFVSNILSSLSSREGLAMLVIIPVILMGLVIMLEFLKDLEINKLQRDVIEEKRKITDDICVRHKIGFSMSKKDKYKVLAQAPDHEKTLYVSLLWKDGSAPSSIKKYCHRKQIMLSSMQKKLEIRRKCDQMFRDGVSEKQIAKFYHSQKELIERDDQKKKKLLKKIKNSYAHSGEKF